MLGIKELSKTGAYFRKQMYMVFLKYLHDEFPFALSEFEDLPIEKMNQIVRNFVYTAIGCIHNDKDIKDKVKRMFPGVTDDMIY